MEAMIDQYKIGSGRFILVGVWPANIARVNSAEDPAMRIRQWRNNYGSFLPVVCHWVEVSQHFINDVLQLPKQFTIAEAADVLGWAGVDYSVRSNVMHAIRELGEQGVPLFSEWRKATRALPRGARALV